MDLGDHSTPKPQDLGTSLGWERSIPETVSEGPWLPGAQPEDQTHFKKTDICSLPTWVSRHAGWRLRQVNACQELRCNKNQTASAASGNQLVSELVPEQKVKC